MVSKLDEIKARGRGAVMLLNQTTHWVNIRHEVLLLADMDVAYKRNVIAMLERRAAALEMEYTIGELDALAHGVVYGDGTVTEWREVHYGSGEPLGRANLMPMGDMANDAFDRELERRGDDPVQWLRRTPLMRELARQVADAP